jgi:hypothetical protein
MTLFKSRDSPISSQIHSLSLLICLRYCLAILAHEKNLRAAADAKRKAELTAEILIIREREIIEAARQWPEEKKQEAERTPDADVAVVESSARESHQEVVLAAGAEKVLEVEVVLSNVEIAAVESGGADPDASKAPKADVVVTANDAIESPPPVSPTSSEKLGVLSQSGKYRLGETPRLIAKRLADEKAAERDAAEREARAARDLSEAQERERRLTELKEEEETRRAEFEAKSKARAAKRQQEEMKREKIAKEVEQERREIDIDEAERQAMERVRKQLQENIPAPLQPQKVDEAHEQEIVTLVATLESMANIVEVAAVGSSENKLSETGSSLIPSLGIGLDTAAAPPAPLHNNDPSGKSKDRRKDNGKDAPDLSSLAFPANKKKG